MKISRLQSTLCAAYVCMILITGNVNAAIVGIADLNIESFDFTVYVIGVPVPYTENYSPPLVYNMGVYHGELVNSSISIPIYGTTNYLIESTGTYGAPPSSGTVDTSLGVIDLNLSDWHITISGGFSGDFDLLRTTSAIDTNTYNSSSGEFVFGWSDEALLDGSLAVDYSVELTGTASTIPVPASVWLFGSGLLGLIGVSRRNKAV